MVTERARHTMKRIAATVILSLGTMLGVIGGGATLASAQTTASQAAATKDCYPSCTAPGKGATTPAKGGATTTPTTTAFPATSPATTPAGPTLTAVATPATGLAFTGTDVVGSVVGGLVLIGGGLLLVTATRRRRQV
jgi:hypothetical protein